MRCTKAVFLTLIYLAAVLSGAQGKCETTVEELTWQFVNGRDTFRHGIESVKECHELCANQRGCKGYTWRYDIVLDTTWCYEFEELEDIHECPGCSSGVVPITFDEACTMTSDNVINEVLTATSQDCYESCVNADGCTSYTWYNKSTSFANTCFKLSGCYSLNPCFGCTSGKLNCMAPAPTTTSPSTSTTTSLPTTQLPTTTPTTPPPAPHQCSQYSILDERSRNEYNTGYDMYCDQEGHSNTSPQWKSRGYYRFVSPAGVKLSTTVPGYNHCGTHAAGWINDDSNQIDTMQVGDEITVQVCFADSPSNSCYYHNEVIVTKCPGDFYVYFLESTPQCDLRYCAASDK